MRCSIFPSMMNIRADQCNEESLTHFFLLFCSETIFCCLSAMRVSISPTEIGSRSPYGAFSFLRNDP